jgi:hypothetical protein
MSSISSIRRIALTAVVAFAVLSCHSLLSQSTASQDTTPGLAIPNNSEKGWNGAANQWRLKAVDIKSQVDTVSPLIRAQRNNYWKPILEDQYKFYTLSTTRAFGISGGGSYIVSDPELSYETGSVWIIATFEGFHVFSIDSEYPLLYTEMDLRINTVIRAPDDLHLTAGSLINSDLPGGKIKDVHGRVISSLPPILPTQYHLQPGHKYLLKLLYGQAADIFTMARRWDISSGTVKPIDQREIYMESHNTSTISGMTEKDLINYLLSTLPAEPSK